MEKSKCIQLRCRCGWFRAEVRVAACGPRAVCYCVDCQAYADWIKKQSAVEVVDALGGTEVLAIRPHQIGFTQGKERLAYMSLTPLGSLRWYADCCKTPIANMKRNPNGNHISIVGSCYDAAEVTSAYGASLFHVKASSGLGPVPRNNPFKLLLAGCCFALQLLWSNWCGYYRKNPFFTLL